MYRATAEKILFSTCTESLPPLYRLYRRRRGSSTRTPSLPRRVSHQIHSIPHSYLCSPIPGSQCNVPAHHFLCSAFFRVFYKFYRHDDGNCRRILMWNFNLIHIMTENFSLHVSSHLVLCSRFHRQTAASSSNHTQPTSSIARLPLPSRHLRPPNPRR